MASDYLLDIAAKSYGFDRAACQLFAHGREEAKRIYTFTLCGQPYVLRLVKGRGDDLRQAAAEMDWLCYLTGKGANVPLPLRTKDGALAISIEENGETYILSAVTMLQGQHWNRNDPNLWNASVLFQWGKAVGDMHRLSKDYTPMSDVDKRGEFSIRGMIGEQINDFPSVNEVAEKLLDEIDALPKDETYGLIHNDLHPGNFLFDGERVYLYDFDGCAYSWYAFDIGNALYLALWMGRNNDAGTELIDDIVNNFVKGYLSANRISEFWLSKIPLFMMVCKIALFSMGCDCENPYNGHYNDRDQEKRMRNIEKSILFAGHSTDDLQRCFPTNGELI